MGGGMGGGMGDGSRTGPWRRGVAGIALAAGLATAGPARADCLGLLPSCWAERIDAACVAAPTHACVADRRIRLLDRAMRENAEENRSLFFEQSFEAIQRTRSLDEARRIAALGERWGFQPNNFGKAVRAFAEARHDWNGALDRGDLVGALAAVPAPDLPVSDRWLFTVVDTIFTRAQALGRGGEVLQAIAEDRIASSNWTTVRPKLFVHWFEGVVKGEVAPDLADRLIALAPTGDAVAMRLARATIADDPAEIGRAIAREYPNGTDGRDDHDPFEAIWNAYRLLETREASLRERFLDALPRSVAGRKSAFDGVQIDKSVLAGEPGVVRRLVARTLPSDTASTVYLWEAGLRSQAIAASLPELDRPDRLEATGTMARVLFHEGRPEQALTIALSAEMRGLLFADGEPTSLADALAVATMRSPPSKAAKKFLALFRSDDLQRLRDKAELAIRSEALLAGLAAEPETGGELSAPGAADEATLDAAFDGAAERRDCRAMSILAQRRGEAGGVASLLRDFDRIASCVDAKEPRG